MALTPLDIHHKEFKSARFGGYNEEDVDSFLDLVADEFERLIQEDSELRSQMEQMRLRLAEFEDMQSSLQSALLAATRSAETVREEARQESEAMIAKAQEEADSLVRSAQEQARQMTLRAQNERQKLERSFAQLKQIKRRYLQSIREIADAHLAQVADLEARDEADALLEDVAPDSEAQVPVPDVQPPPLIEAEKETDSPAGEKVEALDEAPDAAAAPPLVEAPVIAPPPPERRAVPPPSAEHQAGAQAPPLEARDVQRHIETPVAAVEKPPEKPAPPSSNLVEEVLAMDNGDDIYEGLDDSGEEDDKGRKSRKQKREKHFFWE